MRDLLGADVVVSFHGVRGSTPCSCPSLARYGGNTSCISIDGSEGPPIILDLGTGIRQWGQTITDSGPLELHALVSHLHWDHIQGLPFFTPLQREGTSLHVHGPGDENHTLEESFSRFMTPPFFPIRPDQLPATIEFHDAYHDDFEIGDATIMARPVPHTGPTTGYRVTRDGVSVTYIPDHQEPVDDPGVVADSVLELCEGVDLLIHDAQLRPDEFATKADWGHCTPDYAVEVARQSGARSLALFHHDPSHDDDEIDRMTASTVELAASVGLTNVIAASEGLKLSLAPVL